ncbi:MAG: hypothetical protein K2X11_22140 [Acetobacteraceae bacterium]|nr:hypothetical protein [Acetobacteraceae bacterium]
MSARHRSYVLALEDFDAPAAPPSAAPAPDPLPGLVAAAREEGFRAGEAAGAAAMRDALEAATLSAIDALRASLARDAEALRAEAEARATGVARAALAALLSAFPTLAGRFGEAEAARFAEQLLPSLAGDGALRLEVAPALRDAIARRLAGTPGLDIEADAALEPGEARITWRDGAAERRTADAIAAVTALLADHGLA